MTEMFSASRAARHMACPGSANLPLAIPNWTPPDPTIRGVAADHGTDMHAIFEKLMELPAKEIEYWIRVLEYMHKLRSTRRFKVLTEQKVEATWLPADPVTGKHPMTTVDLVLYTMDEIHVIDLKWGKILVEVIDNDQLMYYLMCFAHLAPKAKGATLHILQPAADNLEAHFVTATEIAQWRDRAVATQVLIHQGDTTLSPSDECKFCPAYPHSRGQKGAPLCPAAMQLLYPTPFDEDEILNL